MRTALIFGINGQDGYYLNLLLTSLNIKVIGISRSLGSWLIDDVSNKKNVEQLIKTYKPEFIFHLAANSSTRHDVLFENHLTISTGTLNILESAYKYSPQSKIFISGSALQFVNTGKPISENDPFEAKSTYAVARIQSVYAARYYRSLGLFIYVGYFFHHDSPSRSERHLNMKIVKAAIRIKNGSNEMLEIGNVDIIKEYNYADDIVKAIWMLVNQEAIFEAVIGSGIGYSIKQWLEICFNLIEINWEKYVEIKNNYQPDFLSMISNPKTIFSLGWTPLTNINELAGKMMNLK